MTLQIEEFFKPLGGDVKKKYKGNIEILKASAYFELGEIKSDLKGFKEAKKKFEESAKLNKKFKNYRDELRCKSWIKRIEVITELYNRLGLERNDPQIRQILGEQIPHPIFLSGWQTNRAPGGIRTPDLVITSHPLYQLSYRGI